MINWEEINKRLGISTFEDEKKLYPEKFAPPNPFSGGITGFDKEENDLPAWADAPHFGTSDTATAQSTPSGLEKNIQKAETEESEYQENEYEIKQQIFNKIQEDETAFNALMGYADAGQGSNVFNALSESSKEYGILSGEQYGRALTAPDTADKKETERYDLDLDLDINTDVFGSTPAVSTPKSTFDFFQLEVGNMITDAIKKDIKETLADLSCFGGIIEEKTKGSQPKTGWTDMNFFEKTAEVLQKVDKNIWQTPITIGSYIIGSGENTLRALEWQGFNALKPLADKLDSWQQIASQYVDDNMFQKFVGAGTSMATFFIPAVGTFKLATMVGKFSPRLASLAGGNMMTLFESALEAGDVYDTQKKMGADHETANAWADFTFWGNTALLGATNMLGIFNPAFTRGLIKTMVSSGLEGIQEGGQTMMSNVATGKPIMDDTFESFILGAVMGGVMGGYQSIQEGKDMSLDPEIQAVREAFQSRAGFAQIPGKQLVPGEQDDITKAKAVKDLKKKLLINERMGKNTAEIKKEISGLEKKLQEEDKPIQSDITKAKAEGKSFEEFVDTVSGRDFSGEPLKTKVSLNFIEEQRSEFLSQPEELKRVIDELGVIFSKEKGAVLPPKSLDNFFKGKEELVQLKQLWDKGGEIQKPTTEKKEVKKVIPKEKTKGKPDGKYIGKEDSVKIYRITEDNKIEIKIVKGKELNNFTKQGTWSMDKPPVSPSVKKILGEKPSKFIKKRETALLKEKLQTLARGYKGGKKLTKTEILSNQKIVKNLIKDSELLDEDKKIFVQYFDKDMTDNKFEKLLPQILDKIAVLEETGKQKVFSSQIKKEFKSIKPRMQSGKKVGKLTPATQKILNLMDKASRLSEADAQNIIANNLNKPKNGVISVEMALENQILNIAGGVSSMDSIGLQKLLTTIKNVKTEGQLLNALKLGNRLAEYDAAKVTVINEVSGGENIPAGVETTGYQELKPGSIAKRAKKYLANFGKSMISWNDVMNRITRKSKTKSGQSFTEKFSDVMQQENAEKRGIKETTNNMRQLVYDSYNITGKNKDKQVRDILNKSNETIIDKKFINSDGVEVSVVMTRGEARKRYMEFQDETLAETFEEGMKYTEEIKTAIENSLSKKDKLFAKKQLEFYSEYYNKINVVYEKLYGVSLDKRDFYSPIMRKGFTVDENSNSFGEFLENLTLKKTTAPGALKSRTKNINSIKQVSDILTLERYTIEMEHFIAWAEKIRELNAIYRDYDVKKIIQTHHGKDFYGVIMNFINDFTNNGVSVSHKLARLDKFRINFTKAQLGIKGSIGIKQLTSFIAYADVIPTTAFATGVADFFKNPADRIKTLKKESILFSERGQNIERDLRDIARTKEYRQWLKKPSFINWLMLNVQLGDQGAIAIGGWSVYRHTLLKTGSKTKAVEAFEQATKSAQQSADLSELSTWQRGNSFAKILTMFQSAPNQFFRHELKSMVDLTHGRVTPLEAAKTIAIYHFLIPMFFQLVSDLGWDKDKQKRAAILGSFNGIFIISNMLEALVTTVINATKETGQTKLPIFDAEIPLYSIADDTIKAIEKLTVDDIGYEDVIDAIKHLSGATGAVIGLPLKTGINIVTGVPNSFLKGDYEKMIYNGLGFSEYTIEQKEKREEKAKTEEYDIEYYKVQNARKKIRKDFQPRFDELRTLRNSDFKEFKRQIDYMAENEPDKYEVYKDIKASESRKDTLENKPEVYKMYKKAKELKGNERKKYIDSMTDDEYEDFDKMRTYMKMEDYTGV